jgi:homoserine dehydrogenase
VNSPVNIGLLGFGNVGIGTFRTLTENARDIRARCGADIAVRRVAVARPDAPRPVETPPGLLTGDPYEVINDPDIAIVCELIGGVEPAREYVLAALRNRKHVVTANKELLARHGAGLLAEADANGVSLLFEAAVAGGIPIIRPLLTSLAANRIERVEGVVNGTTNFILSRMAAGGADFADALAEAQRLGYAEAEPSADVDGLDAAYKMCVLAAVGFGAEVHPDDVSPEGIRNITGRDFEAARQLGYTIKLLGIARRAGERLDLRVHPSLLPAAHPLASVDDVYNAVMVTGSSVGDVMFYGRGAGSMPTGSAVAGDVLELARHVAAGSHVCRNGFTLRPTAVVPLSETTCPFYIRMVVADRPRALAAAAGVLGDHGVSIAQVVQREHEPGRAEIVWLTHPVKEAWLRAALDAITEALPDTTVENVIRVEG